MTRTHEGRSSRRSLSRPRGSGRRRPARRRDQLPVLLAVALGGGLGAAARYGAEVAWPTPAGGFPWTTLGVNALGSALIGVFLVAVTEVWAAHRLLRPFVGTGVLGGFTTFSTYALEVQRLVDRGQPGLGITYAVATVTAALLAVWATAAGTRRLLRIRRHR